MNKEYDLDTDVLKLALLSGSCYSVNLVTDTVVTDVSGAINIPVNGGDITVDWNASGIFALQTLNADKGMSNELF